MVIDLEAIASRAPSNVSIEPDIDFHLMDLVLPRMTRGCLQEDSKAALAVIFQLKSYSQKLSRNISLYTAELLAINLALQYTGKYSKR